MVQKTLLANIWSGKLEVREGSERSPLATLLSSILTVPTVALVVDADIKRPVAFADSAELMPGLPLGDVLTEELGFDVPVNSVILIEPAHAAEASEFSAAELGRDLGRVLTSVAGKTLSQGQSTQPNLRLDEVDHANMSMRLA